MRKLIPILMTLFVLGFGSLSAQTRVIKGTVVDADTNEPLVGVTVNPIGGGQGVATNVDGQFTLNVPASVKKAKVSYVGYQNVTVDLRNGMVVKLTSTTENLDDLVVVAYGQQKKSSITGSISEVKADKIAERPVSSVTSALEGTTSGITVSGNYGSPGESPTILIRGIGTVNGSTAPLYVIDGVPFGGNISDLNPDDIESMSVLKDAASTALYGNRASNGVILITTKKAKSNSRLQINFKMNQGWYERGIKEYDRLGAKDWMNMNYQLMVNNRVLGQKFERSNEANMTAAHEYAKSHIISNWLYDNPWNVDEEELFTTPNVFSAAGVFNPSAEFLGTIGEDLDWWDQATRNGYRGEYNLSAMGATSKSDYMFSLGYLNEEGYMKDNDFERITGRANVNIQPLSWLKGGLNLTVTHQKIHGTMNGVGDGSSSYNNAFYFCRYMSPIYPVHEHDYYTGDYVLIDGQKQYATGYQDIDGKSYQVRNQNVNRNVIWESQLNKRQNIRNTMNGTAYVDFILPYGFTVKIQGNLNTRNTDYYNYQSAVLGDAMAINGSLAKTLYTYKNYTFMQQLLWNKTYGEKHHINAILAHENYAYRYDYTYTKKANQGVAGLTALSNFSLMQDITGYLASYRTESYLARVQYNYADKYNVEASFRRDGSSRFARSTRWGNFGSVGANWVFSNESFIKENAPWLNEGKLFANWGQVGNDGGAGYYSYMMLYGLDEQAGNMASVLTQYPSENLKWETSETWGIGLEGWLFDRWHLSVEYYNKMNKDLIFNVTYPSSGGSNSTGSTTPSITTNIGNIRNQGVEIATDVDIFRNKDWKINVGANLSYNENRVTKLPDWYKKAAAYDSNGKQTLGTQTGYYSGIYRIQEGHSRYDICYYHYEGVDMMDGYALYTPDLESYYIQDGDKIIGGTYSYNNAGVLELDKSRCSKLSTNNYRKIGDKYYVINTTYAAKQWCGDALPKVYGSFNANVKFKGIKLSAMFTYSLGGKIYDGNYASLMSVGSAPAALAPDIMNSWTQRPEGMTFDSPDRIRTDINPVIAYSTAVEKSMWPGSSSPTSSYQSAGSDRWLISRNYLCFKNLNISYDFPKSLLNKIKISGATVSFSAENLFISTKRKGMNPMMGINAGQSNYLVPARVYSFGLSLNL